jgi:nucleotide-binding universal stress UspA family protein
LPALKQKNLNYRGRRRERLLKESQSTLSDLEEEIEPYDVTLDTSTVFSHNPFEEIFTQARQENTDTVLMNWKEDRVWDTVRTGRLLDELTATLPCDFLVLKDRELDTSDILLPTAGGPDSDLSAEVAAALQQSVGSDVTILHVVDSEENLEQKQNEFEQWAEEKNLEDTEIIVDGSGDIEGALAREAENHTLVIVGATERGLLSRLARGTLHFNVVNELEASVLMAERPSSRSIFQLIFGS